MSKRTHTPVGLTIAGSDSGGGAGIQADLKTFAALGVHGTSAITCLTAQNPREIREIQSARPAMVRAQIEAVWRELPPGGVKTGMLYSSAIIRTVSELFASWNRVEVIVDPVMVASSGARLLQAGAVKVLQERLFPRAALVTPNLPEAEILTGRKIREIEDLRLAAHDIYWRYGCPALVKGGHLPKVQEAVDIYFDGREELLLSAPRLKTRSTHGSGCTYSAAIAGYIALGYSLPDSVKLAKEFITQAIAQGRTVGRHVVLNSFWKN